MNAAQRNFCTNLKTLRKRLGMSEWQMARYLKLSDEAGEALAVNYHVATLLAMTR